jgi:hypothetical protein
LRSSGFATSSDRTVSQEGTVDWSRFWLEGEEDADPTKAEQ